MAFHGAIMIDAKDNIAVCLEDFQRGAEINVRCGEENFIVTAIEDIPFGFKIALIDILAGQQVLKYGESIGIASELISMGQLVHVHNIEGEKGRGDLVEKTMAAKCNFLVINVLMDPWGFVTMFW